MTDQLPAAPDGSLADGRVALHRPGLTPPDLPAQLIPAHVACVMDGNGRWANARGLARTEGHRVGEATMMDVIAGAVEIGIKELSVYAFSTENWRRSPAEVRFLMGFTRQVLRAQTDDLLEWGVRVNWVGREPRLWKSVLSEVRRSERITAGNETLVLNMCLNYGGRAEIADAARAVEQQPAGRAGVEVKSADEHPTVGGGKAQVFRAQRVAAAFGCFGRGQLFERFLEAGEALHYRRPDDELFIDVEEPTEAVLHAGEGGAGLHDVAEAEFFRQIHRQGGEDGDEDADADVAGVKHPEPVFAVDKRAPVVFDLGKALRQPRLFSGCAPVEGDLFAVVADAQQGRAVVRLKMLALDVQRLQFVADEVPQPGGECRVGERNPDEVAVDGEFVPAEGEGLLAGEFVEDGEVGGEGDAF